MVRQRVEQCHVCAGVLVCICVRMHMCVCIYICVCFFCSGCCVHFTGVVGASALGKCIRYTGVCLTPMYTSATHSLRGVHICVYAYIYMCVRAYVY